MGKFLFTMLPANDLGLPTRLVPIARALADRGHHVAVFNPSPAPAKLIAEAGLTNLPLPQRPMPVPNIDLAQASATWDVEQMLASLYFDEDYVRATTAMYVDLLRDFRPDVVVDSFDMLACLAARSSMSLSPPSSKAISIPPAADFCGGNTNARLACPLPYPSSIKSPPKMV